MFSVNIRKLVAVGCCNITRCSCNNFFLPAYNNNNNNNNVLYYNHRQKFYKVQASPNNKLTWAVLDSVARGQGQGCEGQGQEQGLEVRGQGQGLEVQGQGLVSWLSRILEDKDFP